MHGVCVVCVFGIMESIYVMYGLRTVLVVYVMMAVMYVFASFGLVMLWMVCMCALVLCACVMYCRGVSTFLIYGMCLCCVETMYLFMLRVYFLGVIYVSVVMC